MFDQLPKPIVIALAGGIGCCLTSIPAELLYLVGFSTFIGLIILTAIWIFFLSFGIGLGVAYVQNMFLGKKDLSRKQIESIVVGSLIAGIVAGGPGQVLYYILYSIAPNNIFFVELSRTISFVLLGGLMAFIMSKYIPNMKRHWAILGGIVGGFLGALTFIFIAYTIGLGFRQGGAFFLGACIGFMISVVEKVCREAWLTVLYSPKRFSQVNIGSQMITAGSGACDTIHIDGVPSGAISFRMMNGKIECKENGITQLIQPGDRKKLGNITFVVCDSEHPFSSGAKISGSNTINPGSNNSPYSNSYTPPSYSSNSYNTSYGSSSSSLSSRSNNGDTNRLSSNSFLQQGQVHNNEQTRKDGGCQNSSKDGDRKVKLKLPPRKR